MYSPFRHIDSIFWKHDPIQLTFFLTKRCNARCPFCFYLSRQKGNNDDANELSVSEITRISGSLGKLLWLAFSGGEIFLRKDIVEITKIFYKTNKPAIILYPTNGLLKDIISARIEEILRSCPKSSIVVKLSLDGPKQIHDKIRGVAGCYEKTLATYNTLGKLLNKYPNFDLGINTVFCSENQDYIDEVIDFVSNLDLIRTHTVSLVRGEVADKEFKNIDIEKYHRIIKRLETGLKRKQSPVYGFSGARLKAAQDILQRKLIYKTAISNKRLVPCFAGKINIVLTETGELYPCELFNQEMKMGNVRDFDYDIKRMLNTDRTKNVIRSITDKKCFCTHECYFMTNLLFNLRNYPELIREYLQMAPKIKKTRGRSG